MKDVQCGEMCKVQCGEAKYVQFGKVYKVHCDEVKYAQCCKRCTMQKSAVEYIIKQQETKNS